MDLDQFAKDAMSQHIGGEANYRGITFQIFASTVQLARFASAACDGKIDDVYLRAESRGTRVDDLVVVSTFGKQWHFQMKAVRGLKWADVIDQLKAESSVHPDASLILVCHLENRARWLGRTLPAELNVRIDWIDFSEPRLAHQQEQIRALIDDLTPLPNDEASYYAIWRNLLGTWLMESRGHLSDLLFKSAISAKFTIRQLQEPSPSVKLEVMEMAAGMGEMKVELVKGTVIVSDGVISTVVPLKRPKGQTDDEWWKKCQRAAGNSLRRWEASEMRNNEKLLPLDVVLDVNVSRDQLATALIESAERDATAIRSPTTKAKYLVGTGL
jgi:hypothetical protein